MPLERVNDRFPNRLRELRERQLCVSREALSQLAARLASVDPVLYKQVSHDAIKALEAGWTKPRLGTARTLAAALGLPVAEVFTSGIDDGRRR